MGSSWQFSGIGKELFVTERGEGPREISADVGTGASGA